MATLSSTHCRSYSALPSSSYATSSSPLCSKLGHIQRVSVSSVPKRFLAVKASSPQSQTNSLGHMQDGRFLSFFHRFSSSAKLAESGLLISRYFSYESSF